MLSGARVLRERLIHAGHGGREHQLNIDLADTSTDGEHCVALARLEIDGRFHGLSFLELRGDDVAFALHARSLLLSEEHQRSCCSSSEVGIDGSCRAARRTTLLRSRGSAWCRKARNRGELETSRSGSLRCGLLCSRGWGLLVSAGLLLLRIGLLVSAGLLLLRILALRILTLGILLALGVLALRVLLSLLVLILGSLRGVLRTVLLIATGRNRERAKQGGGDEHSARQSDLLGSRANPTRAVSKFQTSMLDRVDHFPAHWTESKASVSHEARFRPNTETRTYSRILQRGVSVPGTTSGAINSNLVRICVEAEP